MSQPVQHQSTLPDAAEEVRSFYDLLCRMRQRRSGASTTVILTLGPSITSTNIDVSGRTAKDATRTTICFGPLDLIGKTNLSSSPVAEHPKLPSMRCVGRRLRLPASTSVPPA